MGSVLILDPCPIVREGIKKVISQYSNLKICPDVNSREESISILRMYHPELIIMEIIYPKMNLEEMIKEFKKMDHNMKILVYSFEEKEECLAKFWKLGIDGYLSKFCSIEDFIKKIQEILNQKFHFQETSISKVCTDTPQKDKEMKKANSLTKRELEVLQLVSEGLLNKEIAVLLNITERTVKNHLSNIFKKMGVSDRTQAVVFAIKKEMIDLNF